MAQGAIKATPASALPTANSLGLVCVGDPIICETLRWFVSGTPGIARRSSISNNFRQLRMMGIFRSTINNHYLQLFLYINQKCGGILRSPFFSYIYENQSRGPHRNQRSVSYGESMEKAIDFCFRTGGTAGSVVTTQIATGVAFMAPSAIRCDRLAERDLSNFPEVLPYSHRWHTVLSTSISSE